MLILLIAALSGLVAECLPILERSDGPERSEAVERLGNLGPAGVAPLVASLDQAGWRGREGIIDALTAIGEPALPALAEVARSHPRRDGRRLSIRAMGRIGGAAAGDSLARLADTPDRDMVAEALGTAGGRDAIGLLIQLLRDPRMDVRRQAATALGKIGDPVGVVPIIDLLADRHHSVRFAAAGALERLGEPAAEALLERMGGLSDRSLLLAVRTLGSLGYRPAARALTGVLVADRWWLRAAAAEALGALGEAASLRDALRSEPHPYVRGRIQSALFEQGTP